jgi:glycosyltransferase involved in cell wall biosynthesis
VSTHYEGMPLALLEGMAAGCAVVGSDVPACAKCSRMATMAAGAGVRPRRDGRCARELLRDDALATGMGAAARAWPSNATAAS